MRMVIEFDRDRCLGCRSCELACSVVHSQTGQLESAIAEQVPPRRRLSVSSLGTGIETHRCDQCLEPLCAFSCKSGALRRDADDKRVHLDPERCVGCFMCLMVCPFGIRPDVGNERVVRCDVCAGREVAGCVEACPTGALKQTVSPAPRVDGGFSGHVVVIGSSAAGIAACEAAREHAPGCSITLVAEDISRYSRPLLSYALAGVVSGATEWRPESYLRDELGVELLNGVAVERLDPAEKMLALTNGNKLRFDRTIIATGARATTLAIPGGDLEGVSCFRNLDDLHRIEKVVEPGRHAVILGGGNVGLQVCEALLTRGMKVSVIVSSPHLLSQMVDEEVGRRVGDLFSERGAGVYTRCAAREILGNGKVTAVRLEDGELIPADLVIVAKGIKPNVEWLRGSGLAIRNGVGVDLCGRTNLSDIFAAGDCAEMLDPVTGKTTVSGIWPVAYETGRSAGSTAVGIERVSRGALRMNASRYFGEPIISIGEPCASGLVLMNTAAVYRKLTIDNARLIGALLYGDVSGAGIFYRLYREQIEISQELITRLSEEDAPSILGALVAARRDSVGGPPVGPR